MHGLVHCGTHGVVAVLNITNYATLVLAKCNVGGSVSKLTSARFGSIVHCGTVATVHPRTDTRRVTSCSRLITTAPRVASRLGMIRRDCGLSGGKMGLRGIAIFTPLRDRGLPSFIDLHSHVARRPVTLASRKTIVSRGLTGLTSIKPNSDVRVHGSRVRACRVPVRTIARGCIGRCVCLAPSLCRRVFVRTTRPAASLLLFSRPRD